MKRNVCRTFLSKYLEEVSRTLSKNMKINPLIYLEINVRTCGSIVCRIPSPKLTPLLSHATGAFL